MAAMVSLLLRAATLVPSAPWSGLTPLAAWLIDQTFLNRPSPTLLERTPLSSWRTTWITRARWIQRRNRLGLAIRLHLFGKGYGHFFQLLDPPFPGNFLHPGRHSSSPAIPGLHFPQQILQAVQGPALRATICSSCSPLIWHCHGVLRKVDLDFGLVAHQFSGVGQISLNAGHHLLSGRSSGSTTASGSRGRVLPLGSAVFSDLGGRFRSRRPLPRPDSAGGPRSQFRRNGRGSCASSAERSRHEPAAGGLTASSPPPPPAWAHPDMARFRHKPKIPAEPVSRTSISRFSWEWRTPRTPAGSPRRRFCCKNPLLSCDGSSRS